MRGCHHSIKLQRSWNKHNHFSFSFQILEHVTCVDSLIQKERFYIDLFNSINNGYNNRYPDVRNNGNGKSEEHIKKDKRKWYDDHKDYYQEKYKNTDKKILREKQRERRKNLSVDQKIKLNEREREIAQNKSTE
jgi:hypothetical protein